MHSCLVIVVDFAAKVSVEKKNGVKKERINRQVMIMGEKIRFIVIFILVKKRKKCKKIVK